MIEDTEYIASWLLQKATECGFKRKLKPDRQSSVSSSSQASSTSTVQNGTQTAEYLVAMSEFEPMAQIISENASKIQFPPSVETIFDRVINGRKDVNKKHTSLPRYKRNLKKDRSHEHFISVVERAYEKLKPYVSVKSRQRKNGTTGPNVPETAGVAMQNSFSGLTVDDTPEYSEIGPTSPTGEAEEAPPEMPPVHIDRDEEGLEEEFHFLILLLLEELHKITEVVLNLWEAYRNGQLDVVVPSLATNIAIDLVRQAEADLDELVVRPKKYPASKYPVWTLPAVAYLCQLEQFDKDAREDWIKPGVEETSVIYHHISSGELLAVCRHDEISLGV
jgi:hypothetical protein